MSEFRRDCFRLTDDDEMNLLARKTSETWTLLFAAPTLVNYSGYSAQSQHLI